ncbi:hypothetical protein CBR_g48879 [Chara braunii]|uniref:Reverse transcriptase domain-containing protein n=1 Tax=Chara braunii TaxID=69332 RepID=A0A388M3Q3_CHABU|nr:hypothetical protein CBR_g48879 [Chara braunii]|eukprot:GBG89171.1 hypothetical protein CBR_g48879 [Chara braunii]
MEGGDDLEALRSQGATPAGQIHKLWGKVAEESPQAATLIGLGLEDLRSAKLLFNHPFDLRSQDRITQDAKREMEEIWDVSMEEPQRGLIGKKRGRLRKKVRAASDAETGKETSASEAEAAKCPKAIMDKPLLPTPPGEGEPEPGTAWANPLVLSSSASLSLPPTPPPPRPLGELNAADQIQVDDMEIMEYQRLEEEQENSGPIQREEEKRAFDDIHVHRMLLLDGKFDELRDQGRLRVVPMVLRLTEIRLQILLSQGQVTDSPPKIPFIKFVGHPSMQKAIVTAERWLGGTYEVLPMKGVSTICPHLKSDSGESLGAYCFMLRAEPRAQQTALQWLTDRTAALARLLKTEVLSSKRARRATVEVFIQRANDLGDGPGSEEEEEEWWMEWAALKAEWDDWQIQDAEVPGLRNKARWMIAAERMTKTFFKRLRPRRPASVMLVLDPAFDDQQPPADTNPAILEYAHKYYSYLLTQEQEDSQEDRAEALERDVWAKITAQLDQEQSQILEQPITQDEIFEALADMPGGKAPGPDGMPLEHIKACKNMLAPHLVEAFNSIWDNAHQLAQDFALATVILVFKKGSAAGIRN